PSARHEVEKGKRAPGRKNSPLRLPASGLHPSHSGETEAKRARPRTRSTCPGLARLSSASSARDEKASENRKKLAPARSFAPGPFLGARASAAPRRAIQSSVPRYASYAAASSSPSSE